MRSAGCGWSDPTAGLDECGDTAVDVVCGVRGADLHADAGLFRATDWRSMFVSMSNAQSILLSALIWPAWGFVSGWWYRRKSEQVVWRERWHLRVRSFEAGVHWYSDRLCIHSWKDRLPETGGWFSITKRHLPGLASDELERFALECRRGELTHWSLLFATPAFAVWNSGLALVVMLAVGLGSSVPFIAVLRYNRLRIERILVVRGQRVGGGSE